MENPALPSSGQAERLHRPSPDHSPPSAALPESDICKANQYLIIAHVPKQSCLVCAETNQATSMRKHTHTLGRRSILEVKVTIGVKTQGWSDRWSSSPPPPRSPFQLEREKERDNDDHNKNKTIQLPTTEA